MIHPFIQNNTKIEKAVVFISSNEYPTLTCIDF